MNVDTMIQTLVQEVGAFRWQEWLSTICQIASVWYARKNNVLVYPTGIIGVILAAWMYFVVANPPLYADGSLNIYYFIMSLYGWYAWRKKDSGQLNVETYPISWCTKKELWIGVYIFVIGWIILYYVLHQWTNSNVPMLDALVSSSAVTAMWWMARRKVENWLAWIASNIVAIPLNFYKGFILFTVMYVIFLVLAWMGYQTWKKKVVST
jgi:nicotinamide mononucleotide transporter